MALRYDSAPLGTVTRLPSGALRVPARLTRTGVFTYRNPDGTPRREYRPPEAVFAPASLEALRGATVTDLHPKHSRGVDRVDAENWRDLAIGHVGDDVRQAGEYVEASIVIADARAIQRIEARERTEVSVGYQVDLERTPGTTPSGEAYDAIQRNIRPNHVAIVPRGRAGRDVSLRLDADDNERLDAPAVGDRVYVAPAAAHMPSASGRGTVREIGGAALGVEFDAAPGVVHRWITADETSEPPGAASSMAPRRAAPSMAAHKMDAAEEIPVKIKIAGKEYEAGSPEAIAAQAALEAQAQRADALEQTIAADRSKRLRADVARAKIQVRADADDASMMAEVVKKIAPDVDLSGASPEFVAGAFAVAIAIALAAMGKESPEKPATPAAPGAEGASAARADAVDAGRKPAAETRDDAETAEDIRQKHIAAQRRQAFAGLT